MLGRPRSQISAYDVARKNTHNTGAPQDGNIFETIWSSKEKWIRDYKNYQEPDISQALLEKKNEKIPY